MRRAAAALTIAAAAVAMLAITQRISEPMPEKDRIAREWVEIEEKRAGDRLVLKPVDAPIPPARGGRRRLALGAGGVSTAKEAGPTDRSEPTGTGSWRLEGDRLHVDLPGWEGEYEVESLKEDELILRKL